MLGLNFDVSGAPPQLWVLAWRPRRCSSHGSGEERAKKELFREPVACDLHGAGKPETVMATHTAWSSSCEAICACLELSMRSLTHTKSSEHRCTQLHFGRTLHANAQKLLMCLARQECKKSNQS